MFVKAYQFKRWADERTLRAIETMDSISFPDSHSFVHQQLNHMVIVEELFISRLANTPAPHDSTNTETVPEFNELDIRLMESNDWYCSYISETNDLSQQISFTFADGRNGMMSVQEILFHIVSHASYHRGNIAHALDLALVPHPVDGYGIFLHATEPERRETKLINN